MEQTELVPGFESGQLTVIEPINGGKFWLCQCACGKTTKASKWHLLRKKRKSCGCRTKNKDDHQLVVCRECNIPKPRSEYYRRKSKGADKRLNCRICKPCFNKRMVEYGKKARKEVMEHYGGKCACCGEENYEFLSLDHIDGGGNKHRREENINQLWKWLKKNNYPQGFRVLCRNCNFSYGAYGYCPHHIG